MEKNETRVFYVVDSVNDNEEIFDTLEKAEYWYEILVESKAEEPRIYIAIVRNAFLEDDGNEREWNYEDLSNTFEIIKIIK